MNAAPSRIASTILIAFFICTLAACGKRGSPLPPENLSPASVRDFRADGVLNGVRVSWIPPSIKVAGEVLDDLDGFVLRRASVSKGRRGRFQIIARIRYETQKGKAGLGERLQYVDRDIVPGERYDYRLQAYNKRGYEGLKGEILRVLFKGRSSEVEVLN